MDHDGWHKFMAHFTSMCCSSHLNPQVIFYYGHGSYFDDRALYIFCIQNIQYFILKAGDFVHDYPNNNSQNTKIKNFYGNARMNWTRYHGTLKFSPPHMN